MTSKIISPGSTIGVLGSGQLGRMFAIAARQMGYRVHTFSPNQDTPTGHVADQEIIGSYDDIDAVKNFAKGVDVVTFEFENVSSTAVEAIEKFVPVRPNGQALHITQNRLREKNFLLKKRFPIAPFRHIESEEDLKTSLKAMGTPVVLKTAGFGYDGKGQKLIQNEEESKKAYKDFKGQPTVLESFIDFEAEVSVIGARALNGATLTYGPHENIHKNHILDISVSPARMLTPSQISQAMEMTQEALKALDIVGVLCVEFFLTKKGKLIINELAPRPHNSGHLTVDASLTSQFEQQLRAVCGLPLGSTEILTPSAMANLLGNLWQGGEPGWARACALPTVKLHLYGKTDPRPGRKMGHLTALAPSAEEAVKTVQAARRSLEKNLN